MAFYRRSIYHRNQCEFQGTVCTKVELEQVKKADKTMADKCSFTVMCNSNPCSPRAVYFIDAYAFGGIARDLAARVTKGDKVFIICEYKPQTIAASKKNGTEKSVVPKFEVKFLVIEERKGSKEVTTFEAEDFEEHEIIDAKEVVV